MDDSLYCPVRREGHISKSSESFTKGYINGILKESFVVIPLENTRIYSRYFESLLLFIVICVNVIFACIIVRLDFWCGQYKCLLQKTNIYLLKKDFS